MDIKGNNIMYVDPQCPSPPPHVGLPVSAFMFEDLDYVTTNWICFRSLIQRFFFNFVLFILLKNKIGFIKKISSCLCISSIISFPLLVFLIPFDALFLRLISTLSQKKAWSASRGKHVGVILDSQGFSRYLLQLSFSINHNSIFLFKITHTTTLLN